MGKKNPNRIIVKADDLPDPNGTLISMLADGERPKAGEPGTLADRLGGEMQEFLAYQTRVADKRRSAVKGTVTLKIDVSTGPDGSHIYQVSSTEKRAKMPAGISTVFTDEDGDLIGRPMSDGPLTDEMKRREVATKSNGNESKAEPMVGKPSNL